MLTCTCVVSYPFRNSTSRTFLQNGDFKICNKFTGEHLCRNAIGINLFQACKKRLWHRQFSVNFVKFLKTAFLQNTSASYFCPQYCTTSEKVHDVYYPNNFCRVNQYVLRLIRIQSLNDVKRTEFITIILNNILKVFVLYH